MLAMIVNEDAGSLTPRGYHESIASMLAPTEGIQSNVNQLYIYETIASHHARNNRVQ